MNTPTIGKASKEMKRTGVWNVQGSYTFYPVLSYPSAMCHVGEIGCKNTRWLDRLFSAEGADWYDYEQLDVERYLASRNSRNMSDAFDCICVVFFYTSVRVPMEMQ